jgi:hypothetical protein
MYLFLIKAKIKSENIFLENGTMNITYFYFYLKNAKLMNQKS